MITAECILRITILFLHLNLLCLNSFAQREAFHWIGANGAHLDFRTYPLKFSTDAAKFEDTTSSSFQLTITVQSDKNGNLLFYFNGQDFYNYQHRIIQGAKDTLKLTQISGSRNSLVIVPIEGCKFYVFSDLKARSNGTLPSQYHVVDMSANNGLGKVLSVNNYIYKPEVPNYRMAATKHKNMIDTWLIANDNQNTFYAYLIDYETGIISPPIISKFDKGYIWFQHDAPFSVSPKGDYITTLMEDVLDKSFHYYSPLFSFDNETGLIKLLHLGFRCNENNGAIPKFSNNGEYLFYEQKCKGGVFGTYVKVKLSSDSIQYNRYLQTWSNEFLFGKGIAYTAPTDFSFNGSTQPEDFNITGKSNSEYLGMMTDLNKPLTTYHDKAFTFWERFNDYTPPTRPRQKLPYFFKPKFISNYQHPDWTSRYKKLRTWYKLEDSLKCIQDSAALLAREVRPHDSLIVYWGDGQKLIYQGNAKRWAHKYNKAGKYQIVLRLHETCAWDTDTFNIEILPAPEVKTNPDSAFLCGNQTITASVQNPDNAFQYYWSNTSTGNETQIKEAGTYKIRASNACGWAEDTIVVQESKWEIPNVFTPNNDGMNETWNLNSKTKEKPVVKILNRWGSTVYETESYSNTWDANGVPDGIYFYQVIQNEGCQYKGWVEVLR